MAQHMFKLSAAALIHGLLFLALFQIAILFTSEKVNVDRAVSHSSDNVQSMAETPYTNLRIEKKVLDVNSIKTDVNKAPPDQPSNLQVVEFMNHEGPHGESICEVLQEKIVSGGVKNNGKRLVVYKRSACNDKHLGNRLVRLYSAWLLAEAAGAKFSFSCQDPTSPVEESTIMAQLEQFHGTPSAETDKRIDKTIVPPLKQLCQDESQPFLDPFVDLIRYDFRTMAAQVEFTDVAIHYRCGDALVTANGSYGVLPHSAFKKIIAQEYNTSDTFSISIVTQPYDPAHLRERDQASGARCKLLVQDLIAVLNKNFPSAKITVYNDPETETMARTYARLVKAKRATICGPSTFCALPALASEGRGYVYKSPLFTFQHAPEGVTLFESPKLRGDKAKKMSDSELLTWLRDE